MRMSAARKPKKNISHLLSDYHLLSFDELDSTNEEAKRLAKSGGCHGAVVWAKRQTAGKGRMGREWISSEGNLFVSILLQPERVMADLAQLSFVAAISVIDAIEPMLESDKLLQNKWPNDVLLNDKKLSGILLESFRVDGSDKPWVIVGVGVNIDSFPENTEFPATSLKEAGVELVSAKIILSRFIHHFMERYDQWNNRGFLSIRRIWLERAWRIKEKIEARLPSGGGDTIIQGIFEGIDTGGSLIIKPENGRKQTILAADVYDASGN